MFSIFSGRKYNRHKIRFDCSKNFLIFSHIYNSNPEDFMPYPRVNPESITVYPLSQRLSKSSIVDVAVDPDNPPPIPPGPAEMVKAAAEKIREARSQGAAVIIAFGAHLVKNGLAPVLIRLMEEGWVTHLAGNGACGIHDWEFAWHGRSEEDVRANIAVGRFGTWEETGKYINLAVQLGALRSMGYGEALGALILEEKLTFPSVRELQQILQQEKSADNEQLPAVAELLITMQKFALPEGVVSIPHPFKNFSIFGNAFQLGVPATIHPGIGYDIIYNNPFANGGALGRAAHLDFLTMVHSVANLTHGVFLSIGSAIMAPQVFEKALSFANNIRLQQGQPIVHDFTIVINDLQQAAWDWSQGEPPKSSPDYYFRFLKSFYRMGGEVSYAACDNRVFLGNLYAELKKVS
jgi:hypothetical protein